MKLDNNIQAFFELVRAGLWEKEAQLAQYGDIDFSKILQIATEQSVVGLVVAGLEQVTDVKVPQEWALQFVGQTLQIEQRNRAMNAFVAQLIEKLRENDIYALLVKGQGIAQCYEKPLWRMSGDVDLFLSNENYKKASCLLSEIAASTKEENTYNQHLAMTIDGWEVELHGTLRSGLWKDLEKEIDQAQMEVFNGGKMRSWMNGNTQVLLPAIDEDVVFVFSHILQHFFLEGIGLRQICDWCRLLWTYRDSIDLKLLERRLLQSGVISEWQAFAAFAVQYLGIPKRAMPMLGIPDNYNAKLNKKVERIREFVLTTGNFGHNRDYSYYRKYPYVIYKIISLWHHIKDTYQYAHIFPFDSLRVMWSRLRAGISVFVSGK